MPSWIDLVKQFDAQPNDLAKINWLNNGVTAELQAISRLRNDRNVIFYASSFLQKPTAQQFGVMINPEDINGFMAVMHQMDFEKGLTLLLHTPGGVLSATETIGNYLRSKFNDIEVIIPTMAMSAGTMISLSANRIVMGRQSQLGPIDSQMGMNGRSTSAAAILDQFELAKTEISANPVLAHAWAPILASLGPALIQEAKDALGYSEKVVEDWIRTYVLASDPDAAAKAQKIAEYFSRGSAKKHHGRRIDREEARAQGLIIEDLEDTQPLQEAVLTAYHIMTMLFEKSPALKVLDTNHGKRWFKNP